MRNSKPVFWCALACFLLGCILLISGSPLLVYPIGNQAQIPLGNVTTALGIIALAIMVWCILHWAGTPTSQWHRILAGIAKLAVVLSAIWWPLGRILSGNWTNSFIDRPTASWWFWNSTYAIVAFPLLLLLVFVLFRVFQGKK